MAVKASLLCHIVSRSCHSLRRLVRLESMNGGLKNKTIMDGLRKHRVPLSHKANVGNRRFDAVNDMLSESCIMKTI